MPIISQYTDPLINKAIGGLGNFAGDIAGAAKTGLQNSALGQIYSDVKQGISNITNSFTPATVVPPVTVTPKSNVLGDTVGSTVESVDMLEAPMVDLTDQKSGLQTDGASLDATLKDITAQLDKIKADAQTLQEQKSAQSIAEAGKTPSAYDLIKENNQKTLEAIQGAQDSTLSADEAMNQALSKYGLNADTITQIKDLNVQVSDINKQIMDLDKAEQQALFNVEQKPIPVELQSAEQKRISRDYGFKRADLIAKGSYSMAIANALQGQWDKVEKIADSYITAATAREKNLVDTLKWGATQYSSLIEKMDASDKEAIQNAITNAETARHNKETEAISYLNAETDRIKALSSMSGISGTYSPGTPIDNVQGERNVLKFVIDKLPVGSRDGAYSAIGSFKNANGLLDLLNQGVKTGPLAGTAGNVGQFFGTTSENYDKFKAGVTAFTANFIKAISGVQVSDKEREFLMGALPSEFKQENVNRSGIEMLLTFLKNKYETQLGINFSDFPNEIPMAGTTLTQSGTSSGNTGTTSSGLKYTIE